VYHRIIIGLALALLVNGCAHDGYARADELQDNERGPRECAASCEQLGMHMSAFVLVDRGTSGCVCSPNQAAQQAPRAELDATGAAAAYAMLEAQRQAQQQQQQQRTQPKP